MKKLIFISFCLFIFVFNAYADTHTVASPYSDTQVQAAVDAASNGDIVSIPACNVTWSAGVTNTKQITIQGAGRTQTIITGPNGMAAITSSGDNAVIKSMNIKADGSVADTVIIQISGNDWRVTDCKLESTVAGNKLYGVFPKGSSAQPDPRGLIDNNEFIDTQVVVIGSAQILTDGDTQSTIWATALGLGSPAAVYIENNTFSVSDVGNIIDGNYAGSYVARYNNLTSTGTGYTIEVHSMQGLINRSLRKWEIYNNLLIGSAKYNPFSIRGGTGVLFNNTLSGTWTNQGIYLDNVRSFTDVGGVAGKCDGDSTWDGNEDATGYPCRDQIGRGPDTVMWQNDPAGEYTQPIEPAYIWNNKDTSSNEMSVSVINSPSENHIQLNRDFYLSARSGYSTYQCPHPLAGAGSCDSGTAGVGGYRLGNVSLGSGTTIRLGEGTTFTLQ